MNNDDGPQSAHPPTEPQQTQEEVAKRLHALVQEADRLREELALQAAMLNGQVSARPRRGTHHGPLVYPNKELFEGTLETVLRELAAQWDVTPQRVVECLPTFITVRTLRSTMRWHGLLGPNEGLRAGLERLAAPYSPGPP